MKRARGKEGEKRRLEIQLHDLQPDEEKAEKMPRKILQVDACMRNSSTYLVADLSFGLGDQIPPHLCYPVPHSQQSHCDQLADKAGLMISEKKHSSCKHAGNRHRRQSCR